MHNTRKTEISKAMSFLKGDLLTRTRKLVKGLAKSEPIWLKAMEQFCLFLSLTLSIAFNNLLVLTFIWVCSNFSFYMWFSIYVLFVISFRFWVLLSHHYFVENVVGFKRIGLICYGLNSAWFSIFAISKLIFQVCSLFLWFWIFFFFFCLS